MENSEHFEEGEIIGDDPGDLRRAISEIPQQTAELMDGLSKNSEPFIKIAGHEIHPGQLGLELAEEVGMFIARIKHNPSEQIGKHKKEIALGVVAVGVVLGAYAGLRLRKRRQD